MRESQAEIKAIEAQLKSIRAESTQRTGSSSKSKRSAKSIAESPSTTLRDSETQFNHPSQTAVLEKPPSTRKSKATKATGSASRSTRSSTSGSSSGSSVSGSSNSEAINESANSPTCGTVNSGTVNSTTGSTSRASRSATSSSQTSSPSPSQQAAKNTAPHSTVPSQPIAVLPQISQAPQTPVQAMPSSGAVPSSVPNPPVAYSNPPVAYSNPPSTPNPSFATNPPSQKRRIESYPLPQNPLPQNSIPQNSIPQNPLPQNRQVPDQLTATVERLHQQSEFYIQQFRQIQARSLQTPDEILDQSFQVLEAHIQHINQLSAVQEAAILGLKAMAEKVEQDWKALELMSLNQANAGKTYTDADIDIPTICAYAETAVPKIEKTKEGSYVLSSRSIDLYKAEREASLNAQALRHLTKRGNPHQQYQQSSSYQKSTRSPSNRGLTWLVNFLTFAEPDHPATNQPQGHAKHRARNHAKNHAKSRAKAQISPTATTAQTTAPTANSTTSHPRPASNPVAKRVVRNRRSSSRRSAMPLFSVREGVAVLLGAIFVRVVLDLILASFPILWTPAIALLVTPAAIAVYRTSHTPRSGIVWSYRLVLIMIGLFLGGRL